MVMVRSNDSCVEAFSPSSQLRFLFSDVSFSAADICELHGYSPGAAVALARMLAGAALAGIDYAGLDETICLHAETGGPLGGVHVEMEGTGKLRGYVYNGGDPRDVSQLSGAENCDGFLWGGDGSSVRFTRLDAAGHIRAQISADISEPGPEAVLLSFYNASPAGTSPVAVALSAGLDPKMRLCFARGLAMQQASDSAKEIFSKLSGYFRSGAVRDLLVSGSTSGVFRQFFGIDDIITGPTRTLQFGCVCSRELAERSYSSRTAEELRGMLKPGLDAVFKCHLCGRHYVIPRGRIAEFASAAGAREAGA